MWKNCLVGYVAGKSPRFKALNGIISNVWKCEATLTIHESGRLIYKFSLEEDKLTVLNSGPYIVFGRPLLLRLIPRLFNFSSTNMAAVLVWVKFPSLPLECWSTACLSKIASLFGKPIQCDRLTASMERLSYVRVLIELNIMKDLPRGVSIQLPDSSTFYQMVAYKTMPIHCKHCRILGHSTSSCKKCSAIPDANKNTQADAKVSSQKHLFDKPCFLGVLAVQADDISGFHANTHIPIVVGAQMRYEITGDPLYKDIGTFFMDLSTLLTAMQLEELLLASSGQIQSD